MSNYKFTKSDEVLGTIIGIILGGLFLLCGLYLLVDRIIPPMLAAYHAKTYIATDAVVVSVKLHKVNDDKDGRLVDKLDVVYEYELSGHRYTGDKVGLVSLRENSSGWQRHWYTTLRDAQKNNQPITVYVNPNNPYVAVIDRTVRKDVVWVSFAIMFFLFGLGGFFIYRMLAIKIADNMPHVDEANDLRTTAIQSKDSVEMSTRWTITVLLNLAGITALIIYPSTVSYIVPGLQGILWVLFLAGISSADTIRRELRLRKLGRAPLALLNYPLKIGDDLMATVDLTIPFDKSQVIYAILSCKQKKKPYFGVRPKQACVEWKKSVMAVTTPSHKGTLVAVIMQIPMEIPGVDESCEVRWVLCLAAALPGIDFKQEYEIDVLPA